MKQLKGIQKTNFTIDEMKVSGRNSKELESLIDPSYFEQRVNKLIVIIMEDFEINDKIIDNIAKVKPNKISFNFKFMNKNNEISKNKWIDIMKVISTLKWSSLLIYNELNFLSDLFLKFDNALVKIMSPNSDTPLFIKWDSIYFLSGWKVRNATILLFKNNK